jgi:hypothetical protein
MKKYTWREMYEVFVSQQILYVRNKSESSSSIDHAGVHFENNNANQFLLCLVIQNRLSEKLINNKEYHMLLDRLNLRHEHERAIEFLKKYQVVTFNNANKQTHSDNIMRDSNTIMVDDIKNIDARKDRHKSNFITNETWLKVNHEKNAVQHFFNRLPNDIHAITYQQKCQWSTLIDNMEHNGCLGLFVHEAIYNPGIVGGLKLLLQHDHRLLLNNIDNNNSANVHSTILQTLLHSGKKANSNVYTYDSILLGLCKFMTLLVSNQYILNVYQAIIDIVQPLLHIRKQYSSVYIMYGITIFDILIKYSKQNKYLFSDVMIQYACLQMKYTLNDILNNCNVGDNNNMAVKLNEQIASIKHETKEKIIMFLKNLG